MIDITKLREKFGDAVEDPYILDMNELNTLLTEVLKQFCTTNEAEYLPVEREENWELIFYSAFELGLKLV